MFVIANNNSRRAVLKDVPDFVGMEAGVDRDDNEAGMPHREHCFEILRTIAHHDRHPVTGFKAERVTQTGGRTCRETGELSPGGVHPIAIGKRRLVSQSLAVAGDPDCRIHRSTSRRIPTIVPSATPQFMNEERSFRTYETACARGPPPRAQAAWRNGIQHPARVW